MNKEEILEHHLHFLSKYRGRRESLPAIEFIHSDKPFFNIAFPLSEEKIRAVEDSFCLYLPEWIALNGNGDFNRTEVNRFSYMLFSNPQPHRESNPQIQVRKATNFVELEVFNLVQGKGFCETEEDFLEWYPWLSKKNRLNFRDENHHFYIACKNEKPVGVTLAIDRNGFLGIYAVATLPEYRNQGVSTSLLKHIFETHQTAAATLQVISGSYAHSLYRKLGFEDVFECAVFVSK